MYMSVIIDTTNRSRYAICIRKIFEPPESHARSFSTQSVLE